MRILIFAIIFLLVRRYHSEDDYEVEVQHNIPHYPQPHYSEFGNIRFFPRIVGGSKAMWGEFPAKVSVQTRMGFHICGGALISLRHILSAAHCVTNDVGRVVNPNFIKIMGDDLSINRWGSLLRQIRFVSHIFVFPLYNSQTYAHDIAVIRTSRDFDATETFKAVPRALFPPLVGKSCQLAGWGAIDENKDESNVYLLRVDLLIIDMEICNGSQSYRGAIPQTHFCAGHIEGGRDACFGDSGGGLICNGQIAGIVSFGHGCGRRNFPGAYVDVSQYNRWIADSMASSIPHDEISTPSIGGSANYITHSKSYIFLFLAPIFLYTLN